MNEIYLNLNECKNPTTGKGYVEYLLWNDFHKFSIELDNPRELGAKAWDEVANIPFFKKVITDALDIDADEEMFYLLRNMIGDKRGIYINDMFYTHEQIKEFLEPLK